MDENDGDFSVGDLSLREALILAEQQPGDDVINFDGALAGSTILLDALLGQLEVTSNVQIDGPGTELLTIDAQSGSRVLRVAAGVEATITAMTIRGGHAVPTQTDPTGWGGGIENYGELTLDTVLITDNESEFGGGVYNAGDLELRESTLSENTAKSGGGLFNDLSMTLDQVTISQNMAIGDEEDPTTNRGGGLFNAGTASVMDSHIIDNESFEGDAGGGGGVFNTGDLQLLRTNIEDNYSDGVAGGVFNDGDLTIEAGSVSSNISDSGLGGGALYNLATALIDGVLIEENTASQGAGVYNDGSLTIHDTGIAKNVATSFGGGVYNVASLQVTNSSLSENEAISSGGGLFNAVGANAQLTGVTVNDNAVEGSLFVIGLGGAGVWNGGDLSAANSTIAENIARNPDADVTPEGGGVLNEGSLVFTNVTIVDNSAELHAGLLHRAGSAVLHNTLVARNRIVRENSIFNTSVDLFDDVQGDFDPTSSHNLIGVIDGATNLDEPSTLWGTAAAPLDPLVGTLGAFGGTTLTMPLWPDSPAVDAGDNGAAAAANLTVDQRGQDRVIDGDEDLSATVDIGAYEYQIDLIAPTATLASAEEITEFGAAAVTFVVRYSDNLVLDMTSVDDLDIRVTGPNGYDQAARFVAVDLAGDGPIREVTYRAPAPGVAWDSSDNGLYEISLLASAVVDRNGNFAPAGVLGTFSAVIDDTAPVPIPLSPVEPAGGLVFSNRVSAHVSPPAAAVQSLFVDLDGGQSLAVIAEPDSTLQPVVQLINPGGQQIAIATSPAPGIPVILAPTAIASPGRYELRISSANNSFGPAAVQIVLNAAIEAERFGIGDNNDVLTAQNVDESMIDLPGGAQRAAVIGQLGTSHDWHRFTLADGQLATIAVAAEATDATLDLYDASGVRLATGVAAGNVHSVISRFTDATADGGVDEYFVKVDAAAETDYTLIITRGADFDAEPNSRREQASELWGSDVVLGHVGRPTGAVQSPENSAPQIQGAPNRVIIGFAPGATQADRDEAIAQLGSQLIDELPSIDAAVVTLPNEDLFGPRQLFAHGQVALFAASPNPLVELNSHPAVRFAEPDYVLRISETIPNDPQLNDLWGLNNTGQTGGVTGADVDAPLAWDVFTGSSDVVIASIDTGVDYTHEDLAANMWTNPGEIPGDLIDNDGNGFVDDVYGIDTVNDDSDPWDDNRHGTHTAGTFGAVGDNGVGVAGVNWNVRIMALKFLDSGGSGFLSDAVAAIEYMTMMKTVYGVNVVVSNNSWGGGGFSLALRDAIAASIDAGIMFVAAAGNDFTNTDLTPVYPGSYDLDGIITVAASDHTDAMASFSNFAAGRVDLAAPGVDIVSTLPGNAYGELSGTSMAAPHVAGAVALLSAFNPSANLADIKSAILDGADRLSAFSDRTLTGGRLNLFGALTELDDLGDWFQFTAASGDVLQITTTTPGDGPLSPANNADPVLELFDPEGVHVAEDDNGAPDGRNAALQYTVAAAGTYRLRVAAASQQGGAYTVEIEGANGPRASLSVVTTSPLFWDVRQPATSIDVRVEFSDSILLTSLDAADLTLGGVAAQSVSIVDGRTAVFTLPGPVQEGANPLMIAAGAVLDLQGTPIDALNSTLWGFADQIVVSTAVDEQDNNFDTGDLSLREALSISTTFSGGHNIQFDESIFGQTIALNFGELRITEDVEIQGPGVDLLTIDALGNGRIFSVARETTASIAAMTLTGGSANTGGAILNNGELTISDVTLTGNEAVAGGAVANVSDRRAASLTVRNSTISNNATLVLSGGAIVNLSDSPMAPAAVTIEDSVITENRGFQDGGAISSTVAVIAPGEANESGVTIHRSTIASNHANSAGGAINIFGGSLSIIDSTLAENTVGDPHPGTGGAVRSIFADVTVLRSTIRDNSARTGIPLPGRGGAMWSTDGVVTITDSTISGNSPGGVFTAFADLVVTNSTFSGNDGAAIGHTDDFLRPLAMLNHLTIVGNPTDDDRSIVVGSRTIVRNSIIDEYDGEVFFQSSNNLIDVDPQVAPLADNGGPTWTHALAPGSPAIDAGDPNAVAGVDGTPLNDQRGAPFMRVYDGDENSVARIDIGAYELQPTPTLPGDLNDDGAVNRADVALLLTQFGGMATANGDQADLNDDGQIGVADVALLQRNLTEVSSAPLHASASALVVATEGKRETPDERKSVSTTTTRSSTLHRALVRSPAPAPLPSSTSPHVGIRARRHNDGSNELRIRLNARDVDHLLTHWPATTSSYKVVLCEPSAGVYA